MSELAGGVSLLEAPSTVLSSGINSGRLVGFPEVAQGWFQGKLLVYGVLVSVKKI